MPISSLRKRLASVERQSTETILAVVDVRDLSPSEALAGIEAKRNELDAAHSAATLIVLDYKSCTDTLDGSTH